MQEELRTCASWLCDWQETALLSTCTSNVPCLPPSRTQPPQPLWPSGVTTILYACCLSCLIEDQSLHRVWEQPPPKPSKKARLSLLLSLVPSENPFLLSLLSVHNSHEIPPTSKTMPPAKALLSHCLYFNLQSWCLKNNSSYCSSSHHVLGSQSPASELQAQLYPDTHIKTGRLFFFFFCCIQWALFNLFLLTSPQHRMLSQYSPPLALKTPSLLSTSLSSLLRLLTPPCLLSPLKYRCSLGPCSCVSFLILHFYLTVTNDNGSQIHISS